MTAGILKPTRVNDFHLSTDAPQCLTPAKEFGKTKILYYKLRKDYFPITWGAEAAKPPTLRSREVTIQYADNLKRMLSQEDLVWCFAEPEEFWLEAYILPGHGFSRTVNISFRETRIELVVRLS